jgi:CO/xanthine dehydrogenase FAD-binding subunit
VDLNTVREVVRARTRGDLSVIDGGTAVVAGGTWVFSEPQVGVHRLVDLTDLGWEPVVVGEGLEIAATCTVDTLRRMSWPPRWPDLESLVALCSDALLASFKVQQFATLGGNIALGLPAGSMTSLCSALDGVAVIWTPDGHERRVPVAALVTGPQRTSLAPGEVIRSIEIDDAVLRSRFACRRMSLAPRGRSGAVVIGRRDADGSCVLTVTASTCRPHQLRLEAVPHAEDVAALLDAAIPADQWYDDVHGAPDWRRHVSGVLAQQICEELA